MKIAQPRAGELRFDGEDATYNYVGEAAVGSSSSSPVWRIYRLENAGTASIIKKWADNSTDFNKVWEDRTTYSYV